MKLDILGEIEQKAKRALAVEERTAVAALMLAEKVGEATLPKERRGRIRAFEKARQKARSEAIRATAR